MEFRGSGNLKGKIPLVSTIHKIFFNYISTSVECIANFSEPLIDFCRTSGVRFVFISRPQNSSINSI